MRTRRRLYQLQRGNADAGSAAGPRPGSVLLLVLVVITLLSYSAYSFSERMIAELMAGSAMSDQMQTRSLAESGIEAAAAFLEDRTLRHNERSWNNSRRFRHQAVHRSGQRGRFSILAELPGTGQQAPVFGMRDESSKLNLNALPLDGPGRELSQRRLLALPGMTAPIAESILDWMAASRETSGTVQSAGENAARNSAETPGLRILKSLHELLQVRGVTRELLYGEDWNGNGLLDANENDGPGSEPDDNANGRLEPGWAAFVTLESCESNLRPDGRPRINVNHPDLPELYDQLEAELGQETAKFIVAWRLAGSVSGSSTGRNRDGAGITRNRETAAQKRRRRIAAAQARLQQQLGDSDAEDENEDQDGGEADLDDIAAMEDRAEVTRDGLRLSRPAVFEIRSVLELVGAAVRIGIDRRDTILKSPWADDPSGLEKVAVFLNQRLTTAGGASVFGRINVNEAPREVLCSVPGINDALAEAMIAARSAALLRQETDRHDRSIVWLYLDGLVDFQKLQQLSPYITAQGDVFRGLSVGHIDGHRMTSVIQFMVDTTSGRARIMELVDRMPSSLPVESW